MDNPPITDHSKIIDLQSEKYIFCQINQIHGHEGANFLYFSYRNYYL